MLKPLPIGIQTFRDIIEGGYLYIDKTKYIYPLVNHSKGIYFLSRPRRFGKSLLLSTLNEIFNGNKELFKGLWLYNSGYLWKEHPVIRIDFSRQKSENKEQLKRFITNQVDRIASQHGYTLHREHYFERFEELLFLLKDKGKIVILIDEYDKPLIDHITNPVLAAEMREILKGFYSIIKGMDEYLRFVLLTGVSKFSKSGVFSGLNQLNDISMVNAHSAILGITEEEIKHYFEERLAALSDEKTSREEVIKKIRQWYNGYCFSGTCANVYNPFSTLLFFENKEFKNYWFETGTPTFLVNLIKHRNYPLYEIPMQLEEIAFSTYEVEDTAINPLLFQTGYLTIKGYDRERMLFTLDYPNFEVKNSFLTYILRSYSERELSSASLYKLIDALREEDFDIFFSVLKIYFSAIPYDIHTPKESYYQTIFYLVFTLIGLKTEAEVRTNLGRVDAVINDKAVFVFEFKLDGSKEEAINQIRQKKYYEKFLATGKTIYLIGVEFAERNIKDWMVERVKG